MKTYTRYRNGQDTATYAQHETKFKRLKEIIARRKFTEKNARLVNIITK
jgi:hypothetical protein